MADHRCYQPFTIDRTLNSVHCLVVPIIHKHLLVENHFRDGKWNDHWKKLKSLTCTAWLSLIRTGCQFRSIFTALNWQTVKMNGKLEESIPRLTIDYQWCITNGHPFSDETIADGVRNSSASRISEAWWCPRAIWTKKVVASLTNSHNQYGTGPYRSGQGASRMINEAVWASRGRSQIGHLGIAQAWTGWSCTCQIHPRIIGCCDSDRLGCDQKHKHDSDWFRLIQKQ